MFLIREFKMAFHSFFWFWDKRLLNSGFGGMYVKIAARISCRSRGCLAKDWSSLIL